MFQTDENGNVIFNPNDNDERTQINQDQGKQAKEQIASVTPEQLEEFRKKLGTDKKK